MNESVMTDSLEIALEAIENVFDKIDRNRHKNFWNNREPKQRIRTQESDTVNALSGFITAVNNAQSKEPVAKNNKSPRRRLESGGVTARG
ncbi:hypothetical protein [Xenorhabdus lircayensis]|uniref:Uncharacterized protein n=1 Tax=Xenorhabdus lircayensis TaxID=2763499 RepID=A0ABS0U0I5_9GAMM|nr:hypothetical protein [Xenorhabdus lircayensis]MBI6547384.1 hypothetical protein [Xenorhabdus lircayensis]